MESSSLRTAAAFSFGSFVFQAEHGQIVCLPGVFHKQIDSCADSPQYFLTRGIGTGIERFEHSFGSEHRLVCPCGFRHTVRIYKDHVAPVQLDLIFFIPCQFNQAENQAMRVFEKFKASVPADSGIFMAVLVHAAVKKRTALTKAPMTSMPAWNIAQFSLWGYL